VSRDRRRRRNLAAIKADILGRPLVTKITEPVLGAASWRERQGYGSVEQAVEARRLYLRPDPRRHRLYDRSFAQYGGLYPFPLRAPLEE
jgi:hypothetical protein